ncbi:YchF/TatD family DNA exonuclease [bacterium]|nr:YchF/TatD family DNA exonuclease [candidate division CSSED10-310 bacterium]
MLLLLYIRICSFMIDTHAHLTDSVFSADRDAVLADARDSGVTAVLTVGTNLEDSGRCVELAQSVPMCHATAGLHPHEADLWSDRNAARIRDFLNRAVAIGETGLDMVYRTCPLDRQIQVFKAHIQIAAETGKPLVIHCRDAYPQLAEILAESGCPECTGVVHCFTGTVREAERILQLGYFLSFGGMLTFKNMSNLREVFGQMPVDRILLETDSPYLTPEPHRGKRNEPKYIGKVYEKAASILSVRMEDMVRLNRTNSYRLFKIGPGFERGSIGYRIRDSLYLNITNRCLNRCLFCVRNRSPFYFGYHLVLDREPEPAQIVSAVASSSGAEEVVFCGYGEPLMRPETVLEVARRIRPYTRRIRLNTSGFISPAVNRKELADNLASVIDIVEVSLGTPDPRGYAAICRPLHPEPHRIWDQVHDFIRTCIAISGWSVRLSCVDYPGVDIEKCRSFAASLNLPLKIRGYRS